MPQFRIKINSNEYSLEMEGETDVVVKYFEEFKTNGLPFQNFLNTNISKGNNTDKIDVPLMADVEKHDQILLSDVVIRQLPGPESEWVLIYSYYASNKFLESFPKSKIVELYKGSKRWTDSNRKNFSKNISIVIDNQWIRSINEDTFVIIDEGIKKVKEIMSRTAAGKKKVTTKKTLNSSKPVGK